jgi:hypothetical protein
MQQAGDSLPSDLDQSFLVDAPIEDVKELLSQLNENLGAYLNDPTTTDAQVQEAVLQIFTFFSDPEVIACMGHDDAGEYYYYYSEEMNHDHGDFNDPMKGQYPEDPMQGAYTKWACDDIEGAEWIDFETLEDTVRHRQLRSYTRWDEENYEYVDVPGSKKFCELEKECNWNSWAIKDKDKCLDPPQELYPTAVFEENGKKMACMECWGKWCHEYWGSRPAMCTAVLTSKRVYNGETDTDMCASQSGGGPSGLAPIDTGSGDTDPNMMDADMMYMEGGMGSGSLICRRLDLLTANTCLDQNVCPSVANEPDDETISSCAEAMCFDPDLTNAECTSDGTVERRWRDDYRAGAGLCEIKSKWDDGGFFHEIKFDQNPKSTCESLGQNIFWWEGREFAPAQYASADTCPPSKDDEEEDEEGWCDVTCPGAVCQSDKFGSWTNDGACVARLDGEIMHRSLCEEMNYCDKGGVREWCDHNNWYYSDWETGECVVQGPDQWMRQQNGGAGVEINADSCSTFVKESFDDSRLDGGVLTHTWHTCVGLTESTCMAYCMNTEVTNSDSCNWPMQWDYAKKVCLYYHVTQETSDFSCSDFANNENACNAANGCWYDWYNGQCGGDDKGCNQYPNSKWVIGDAEDAEATAPFRSGLLKCNWRFEAECKDRASCEATGECNDWFLGHGDEGACVVPHTADMWGHKKPCEDRKNPKDKANYRSIWENERMGCVATKKANDGNTVRVPKEECEEVDVAGERVYPDGVWKIRAETQAECETLGEGCVSKWSDWDFFGGIKEQDKCENVCDHVWNGVGEWRTGNWWSYTMYSGSDMPLFWKEREWTKKNTWDPTAILQSNFEELLFHASSKAMLTLQKKKVLCKIPPLFQQLVPVIASRCGVDDPNNSGDLSRITYSVTDVTVTCSKMDKMKPERSYLGQVDFQKAHCDDDTKVFEEVSIQKVIDVPPRKDTDADANNPMRRLRRLEANPPASGEEMQKVCTGHCIVKNSQNAVVGQKVGPGLKLTGVSDGTLCITVNLPPDQIADEYTERDVVELSDAGLYGSPLGKTITVNGQGEYCFEDVQSGKTYVPVHVMSRWESAPHAPCPTMCEAEGAVCDFVNCGKGGVCAPLPAGDAEEGYSCTCADPFSGPTEKNKPANCVEATCNQALAGGFPAGVEGGKTNPCTPGITLTASTNRDCSLRCKAGYVNNNMGVSSILSCPIQSTGSLDPVGALSECEQLVVTIPEISVRLTGKTVSELPPTFKDDFATTTETQLNEGIEDETKKSKVKDVTLTDVQGRRRLIPSAQGGGRHLLEGGVDVDFTLEQPMGDHSSPTAAFDSITDVMEAAVSEGTLIKAIKETTNVDVSLDVKAFAVPEVFVASSCSGAFKNNFAENHFTATCDAAVENGAKCVIKLAEGYENPPNGEASVTCNTNTGKYDVVKAVKKQSGPQGPDKPSPGPAPKSGAGGTSFIHSAGGAKMPWIAGLASAIAVAMSWLLL